MREANSSSFRDIFSSSTEKNYDMSEKDDSTEELSRDFAESPFKS